MFVFLVWRMRKVKMPRKPSSVLFPVRDAYDAFGYIFSGDPVGASEWTESTFHPPGSTSSRALEISFNYGVFIPSFFALMPTLFSALVRKEAGKSSDKKNSCGTRLLALLILFNVTWTPFLQVTLLISFQRGNSLVIRETTS